MLTTPSGLTKTKQLKSAVIEDSGRNTLFESTAVLNRWIEYCSGLYKYELQPDASLLQSDRTPRQEAESLSALREEVERGRVQSESGKVSSSGQHSL